MEKLAANRLIRPMAEYTGPHGLQYVALASR
jgi:citrate synthase